MLVNGQAAIGTVVAIDEINPTSKYGSSYVVTVEFTPPNYQDSVRFETTFYGSSEVNKLGVINWCLYIFANRRR
jgi:hypothetical protein